MMKYKTYDEYNKLKKPELIKLLMKQDPKVENFDKLKRKYDVVKGARKEDLEITKNHRELVNKAENEKNQLVAMYEGQKIQLQSMIQEQNVTVINLFDALDRQFELRQQNLANEYYYFKMYKSMFITEQPPQAPVEPEKQKE